MSYYVIESRATTRADYRVERAETVRDGGEYVEEYLRFEHAYEWHVIGRECLEQAVIGLAQFWVYLNTHKNK